MKAVKFRKAVGLCQFCLWMLLFVPHAWVSAREKNFSEAALYFLAIVAGVFVTAVFLRNEDRKKAGQAGQDEQEEATR